MSGRERPDWAPFSVDYGFYSPLMSGSIDGTDSRPHDCGVVRAVIVKCKLTPYLGLNPLFTIFLAINR